MVGLDGLIPSSHAQGLAWGPTECVANVSESKTAACPQCSAGLSVADGLKAIRAR